METKVCRRCEQEKTLDEYYVHSQNGKPHPWCKECVKQYQRKYNARQPKRSTPPKWGTNAKWGTYKREKRQTTYNHSQFMAAPPEKAAWMVKNLDYAAGVR